MQLGLDEGWVREIKASLPELPDEKKARFIKAGLSAYDASVLVAEKKSSTYSEPMMPSRADPKSSVKWLKNENIETINKENVSNNPESE